MYTLTEYIKKYLITEQNWGALEKGEIKVIPKTQDTQTTSKTKQTKQTKSAGAPIPPADLTNPINKPGKIIRHRRAITDVINPELFQDLDLAAERSNIGDVQITYAKTGHDQHVKGSTAISRHWTGNAVDITQINGVKYRENPQLFAILGWIFVEELKKLGYKFGEGGSIGQKSYLWQTMTGGNHFNHVHVSIKSNEDWSTKDLGAIDKPPETKKTSDTSKSGEPAVQDKSKKSNSSKLSAYVSKEQLSKILSDGPGPYWKQKPTKSQLQIRERVNEAWETVQNMITYKPEKYFWRLRTWYNDEEELAAKYLDDTYNITIQQKSHIHRDFWKAHPIDRYNIALLNRVVNIVKSKILAGDSWSKTVNYIYYENNKWNVQKLRIRWDYM